MKKKRIFKIISIISFVITIIILSLSLYLNISEVIAMNQCANTPGCMYCVPAKSLIAYCGYIITLIMVCNTIAFFVLYKKTKY